MPAAARVVTELEVDASKAIAALTSYDSAMGKAGTGTLSLVERHNALERSLASVMRRADPAGAALLRLSKDETTLEAGLRRGIVTADQYSNALTRLRERTASLSSPHLASGISGLTESVRGLPGFGLLGSFAAGAGLGILADPTQLVRGVTEAVKSVDELGDAAARAGVSAQTLQVFRYEMATNAGTADEADSALQRFNKSIGELAVTGAGPAKQAMQALGINIHDVGGHLKSTDSLFDESVDKLSRIKDRSQESAIAAMLFGKEAGPALAASLAAGVTGMQEAEDHLKSIGGLMSDDVIQKADLLDKKFRDVGATISTVWKETVVNTASGVTSIIEEIERLRAAIPHGVDPAGAGALAGKYLANPAGANVDRAFDAAGGAGGNSYYDRLAIYGSDAWKQAHGGFTPLATTGGANTDALNKQNEALSNFIDTIRQQGEEVGKSSLQIKIDSDLRKLNALDINSQTDGMAAYIEALDRQADAQKQAISHMDELRDSAKGFLDTLANGGDVVDFFKRKLLDLGETQLTNALFGQQGTSSQGSLLGGIFGNLFGMGSSPAPQSVTSKIGYGIPIPWAGSVTSADIPPLPNGTPNGMHPAILDLISRAEGTSGANGYNTSLGFGRFLPGGQEQNLSSMSLDQIAALQKGMLANPANDLNSSAIGKYQFTSGTLMDLRHQMGLTGSETFDPAMQDKLALQLIQNRGATPAVWQGLGHVDPSQIQAALNDSGQKISTGLAQVAQTTQQAATSFAPQFTGGLNSILQAFGQSGLSAEAFSAVSAGAGGGLYSRVGPPGGGSGGRGGGSPAVYVQVTNQHSGAEVETKPSRTAGGDIRLDVMVKRVTQHVGDTYGLRRPTIGRA